MSTAHLDQFTPGKSELRHKPLSATLLVAALAIAAACFLSLLTPILQTSPKIGLPTPQPTLAECVTITNGTARLACFDQVGKDQLQAPAKGANAPIVLR